MAHAQEIMEGTKGLSQTTTQHLIYLGIISSKMIMRLISAPNKRAAHSNIPDICLQHKRGMCPPDFACRDHLASKSRHLIKHDCLLQFLF